MFRVNLKESVEIHSPFKNTLMGKFRAKVVVELSIEAPSIKTAQALVENNQRLFKFVYRTNDEFTENSKGSIQTVGFKFGSIFQIY